MSMDDQGWGVSFCKMEGVGKVARKCLNEFDGRVPPFSPADILEENDDLVLVAATQSGQGQAFEVLVGRHHTRILRTAVRFTRNEHDAEDIVQQSLQKAFIHLRQFKGTSSFSTWLTRITINEALMWLRRRRASPEIPIEQSSAVEHARLALNFPDSRRTPEDSLLQQERRQILCQAINKLPPGMRAAIELRELEQLSTKEAAGVMGLSVGAVKARVFHGRRKLRQTILRRQGQSRGKDPHSGSLMESLGGFDSW
jgi:RNA polymerase sigma-70 factor (ECF subfamily)